MDEKLKPYRISTVKATGNVFFAHICGYSADYIVKLLVRSLSFQTKVESHVVLPHNVGYITYRNGDNEKVKLIIEREQNIRKGVIK